MVRKTHLTVIISLAVDCLARNEENPSCMQLIIYSDPACIELTRTSPVVFLLTQREGLLRPEKLKHYNEIMNEAQKSTLEFED